MKAYDLICLENLSFGIFRAPELRYQGGIYHMRQYLKKPIWNRVIKEGNYSREEISRKNTLYGILNGSRR